MSARTPLALSDAQRDAAQELTPLLRRAADLDPRSVARLQFRPGSATALVRLPFGVLVSRTVAARSSDSAPRSSDRAAAGASASAAGGLRAGAAAVDHVAGTAELVAWLTGASSLPASRDADWRTSVPPRVGWQRLETVPDEVVRGLVRQGALAVKEAAARAGLPGAQPRAEVADALLDAVVLTIVDEAGGATGAPPRAEVTLRALSALTRMGFLPRGGAAHVDIAGRWIRVAAGYGSVYLEKPGAGLGVLR